MTPTPVLEKTAISYPSQTLERAQKALFCSPFQFGLFSRMRQDSIPLLAIAGQNGFNQQYTQKPLAEFVVDNEFMWLIQVGILRREVDGQGITDSFRLTPLGRQILENLESQGITQFPKVSLWQRLLNSLRRYLRLPDWLVG